MTHNPDKTPETKQDAYERIVNSGDDITLRKRVAAEISKQPGTTPELADRISGRSRNTIRPRVNELVRMGCVKRQGTRPTSGGNEAFIHHLTPLGDQYLLGECDPDPEPPLSELATAVVDAARQTLASAGTDTDTDRDTDTDMDALRAAVEKHDREKQRRNPQWSPPVTVSDKSGGGLSPEEREQIREDPVLTLADIEGESV
jgi:hypothetical protein